MKSDISVFIDTHFETTVSFSKNLVTTLRGRILSYILN
jgi:hypothetical protein